MADTLKDDLLPLIDELRGLPGELGFRPYQVWVRKETWSGSHRGQGTKTTELTRITVGSAQDPKVREVHRKDVTADTAQINAEYDIGPLSPAYVGGGIEEAVLKPLVSEPNVEVFYVIKGKGMPSTGLLCKRVGDEMDRALRNVIRVQSTGRAA